MKIDFKELKSNLEKLYPNQIEREEASLCIKLLQANGGEFELFEEESKIMTFTFDGYLIDFTEDEIVFIGDEGDFAHLEIDYFALLGYMIHTSFLSVGFKRAYREIEIEDRDEPLIPDADKFIEKQNERKCPHCGAYPLVMNAGRRVSSDESVPVCSVCKKEIRENIHEVIK